MGSEARARLGLVALLGVTLLSFTQLFQSGDYPGPAMLGMIIAASIAIATRRVGSGALVALLIEGAALVWYLAFIFEARSTFYGVPTSAAIEGVVESVTAALNHVNEDFAPVPARPGYVVMAIIGLWVATMVGEMATFRWKRPLLASLPCIGLFALLTIVGTGAGGSFYVTLFLIGLLTYWGLEASHRLRTWGRWVPTWSGHTEEEPSSVAGEIGRKMGASTVAIALVAPLFLPPLGNGLLSWRSGGGGGGSGGGGAIDPFVSIAPTLLNQSDVTLFRTQAEGPAYWSLVALPVFDGTTWRPLDNDGEPVVNGALSEVNRGTAPASTFPQEIEIDQLRGDALPVAGEPDAISLATDTDRAGDLRWDAETGNLSIAGELSRGLTYDLSSKVPELDYNQLNSAVLGDPGAVYRELGRPLTARTRDLLRTWTEGEITPLQKLIAIQDHLRRDYTYSLTEGTQEGTTEDPLDRFLFETRAGFCQQFSSAFAALARNLGYPTRIVVGFLPGEHLDGTDTWIVKGTDSHSWPEVYFSGYGWVRFEPTPRLQGAQTARTPTYTVASAGTEGPGQGLPAPPGDGGNDSTATDCVRQLPDSCGELVGAAPAGDAGREGAPAPRIPAPRARPAAWQQTFRVVALVLLACAALFLILVPLLKESAIRLRYRRARDARAVVAAAFADVTSNAANLAAERRGSESAPGYARRLAEARGLPLGPLLSLAGIYEAAEYAPAPLPDERAQQARLLARELRSRLWAASSWWERILRLFSPRGLPLRAGAPIPGLPLFR